MGIVPMLLPLFSTFMPGTTTSVESPSETVTVCTSPAVGAVSVTVPSVLLSLLEVKVSYWSDFPVTLYPPRLVLEAARAARLTESSKPTSFIVYSRFVPPFLKYGIAPFTITLSLCFVNVPSVETVRLSSVEEIALYFCRGVPTVTPVSSIT